MGFTIAARTPLIVPTKYNQGRFAMAEKLSLKGQRIIVTGAGNGLGRAYALLLAELGGQLVVNDFSQDAADAVVAEIKASGGDAVASYDAVGSKGAGKAIVKTALDAFAGVDAVINNAGFIRPAMFEDISEADLNSILQVHLFGSIYVTQAAWPILQKQRYGRVVMTSSSSGMFAHGGMASYSAAKAGVFGLTKALAYEGQDYNIAVNAVLPVALTTINKDRPIPGMAENYAKFITPELRQRVADIANQGPEMVAYLVACLVDRKCEVTGEAYSVSRGRYGRVFVGVADGWLTRKGEAVSPETVRDHLPEIRDIGDHTAPKWVFDETLDVARRL